ncbi:MAG: hypothetical protein JW809_03615 [Pirellulales bacterium]|nr:hypothetical protein [Pirellulales bacterium]
MSDQQETHDSSQPEPPPGLARDGAARAKAEWDKARQWCDKMQEEAAQRMRRVRETTMGDVFDAVLAGVRRRPGVGLAAAVAAGFFLGRLFRK